MANDYREDNSVTAALRERRRRIKRNLATTLSDIQTGLNSEVGLYNEARPAYGMEEEAYKGLNDSKNRVLDLRRKVNAYRSYMNEDDYNSIVSALDQMHQGYGAYLTMSQFESEDAYNTAKKNYGYQQKYAGKSYDELMSVIAGLERKYGSDRHVENANDLKSEIDWLKAYAPTTMTVADYDKKISISSREMSDIEAEMRELESEGEAFLVAQNKYNNYMGGLEVAIEWKDIPYKKFSDQWWAEYNRRKNEEIERIKKTYNDYVSKYGSVDALQNRYNELKSSLASKKRERSTLVGAKTYGFLTDNPDFQEVSTKVSAERKALDPTYNYINDIQGYRQDVESGRFMSGDAILSKYSTMTQDEIANYNYLYNKEGKAAADGYLDYIEEQLNRRVVEGGFEEMKGNTAQEMLFGIAAGLDQAYSGTVNLFNFKDDYIPPSSTQMLSQMVREDLSDVDLKWYNFKDGEWDDAKIFGNSLGQVGYDAITTTSNMAPSILVSTAIGMVNPVYGAIAGNALLGASAAGNAYQEKLNLGYTKEQARSYGIMVGASEAILQYALGGIGKLGNNGLKRVFKNLGAVDNVFSRFAETVGGKILLSGVSEGFEEGVQAVIEPYLWQAVSGEEATVDWQEAMYNSLLGFATGGLFEAADIGGTSALQSIETNYQNKNTGKAIMGVDGGVDALLALADDVAGVSTGKVQEDLMKQTGKVASKATAGKVGKLYNAVTNANNVANASLNQADIAKSLQGKGFNAETANDMAEALVASYNGQELTKAQSKLLESAKNNKYVQEAISSIMENSQSTMGKRSQNIRDFLGNIDKAHGVSVDQVKAMAEGNLTTEGKTLPENHYEVSAEGKTIDKDGNDIVIKGVKSIGNGKMVLETETGTIDAGDVSYASEGEALVYSAISDMDVSAETAWHLIDNFKASDGVSAQSYATFIPLAYKYGKLNYKSGLENLKDYLTIEQRESAFVYGRNDAAAEVKAKVAAKATTTNPSQASVSDKNAKKEIIFDGFTYNEKTARPLQKASIAAIDMINKMSNLEVHVYQSYKKNGKYYANINGKERLAPNGYFTDGNKIYIDINAGNAGQGAMLYTMGHEVGHYIAELNAEDFKAISDFLFEHYGKDVPIDKLLDDQKKKLIKSYEADGKAIPSDSELNRLAQEELVCDMLSNMFADKNAYDKLMELKQKDLNAFQKLGQAIKKVLDKLKKLLGVYDNQSPDFKYAASVENFGEEAFRQLQDLYMRAFVTADENFQSAEAQKNTTEDGGEVQYSLREFEDGTRFVDVQLDAHIFDGMTVAEMNKAVKPILMEKFAGKVIGIDNRVFVNGDSVNEYLHPSKSIDMATRQAKLTAAGELDNLLDAGKALPNRPDGEDGHVHPDVIDFGYFKTIFKVGTEYFEGIVNVKNNKRGKLLKDITKIKNITQDIVSSYGDNPKSNFLRDASMYSIRNESGIVKTESVEAVDLEVDAKTESVAPKVLKSERTWTESDYVQERDKAAKEIASAIGVSVKKAKAYIDSVNSIAKMIAEDRVRLDYFSSPGRSSFVGNVEYGGSFDFSTLCKKRRLLSGTFTAIQKALPNTALTADEILDIRNRMKDAGLEVSCGLCYVEGSRANMGQFAQEFLKLYKQYYPDAWQPNMADVNTPEGIEWVRINHPECYEQYEYFWNHYGTLKEGDPNLFASQQKPKLYQLHTEYKGEILDKFNDDENVEEKNLNGGIRLQSFSDFEIVHLIDTMQIIMDMSRVGLAGQAYTKVPDFAWALGDTGLKINLSLIAKGVDANGKLIFDDVEGMPINDAMKLRDRYSKNVGTILVAFNDEQLMAAMADERVDYIIPFHRSQWKKSQYGAMGLPAKTKDYTYMQNEKFINPQYHEYRGRMVKDKATNYMPNEYWDFSKSGKENAEAYLEMCARNNKRPKFYKLLKNNGDGSYSLKADGSTDGYWKLLIDFKMYDNEGVGSPQTSVKPEFNMDEAQRMLNDYSGGHSNFPVAQGVVDSFVQEYKDSHKGAKFSDRDTDGNQLTEDQQEFFEESKVRDEQGRLKVLYHGSRSEAFTEFNTSQGVWLTPLQSYAELYADMWHRWRDDMDGTKRDDINGLEPSVYADPDYRLYKMYANIKNPADIGELNQDLTNTVIRNLAKAIGVEYSKVKAMSADYEGHWVYEMTRSEKFIELAYQQGFDGFKATEVGKETWCAFSAPNQVKLTTNEVPSAFYDIRYQERDTESVSNRSLLANALEGAAQNEIEKNKIREYKGKIDRINAEEQKLYNLNEQIKELSFSKGPRDTKKIRDLQFEANQTANRISTYDKQLLRLEASKPLQDVLTREKKKAYKIAEQKGKEALAAYREKATKTQREMLERYQESRKKAVESREKTAVRHKIQSVVGELNQLLLSNDKKRHVPDSLKKAVADALSLVNMDTVGAEERAAKYAALIAKETDPDKIDAYTVTMENILRQGEKMGQRLKELRDAYEEIAESDDPDIANAYDPVIAGALKELAGSIGNTSLRNMTIEQLQDVYDMYKMVLTRVRDANKSFLNDKNEAISNLASRVVGEVKKVGGEHKYRAAILDFAKKFGWDNMKPVYAFEHIGSTTLTDAFNQVRRGEDVWAVDVTEARKYYLDKSKKYGYDSWDFKKKYRFKSNSELEFDLTLEQILSLYAYSKREQAHDHLRLGGFVFDSNIETYKEKDGKSGKSILKYKVNTADAHQITPEILAEITGTLSKEQMAFVDEMQEYLSTVMGAKGNEITMKMYGVKLFKEKSYFPLKSAKQFMFEQNEVSGEVRIKNSGFTNKVVAKANNPVILSNFMDVWSNHVNDMSMYHAFVLPLEDFNRIFNYNSPKQEGQPPVSVKGTIQNAYSPAAVNYVRQLITDLNGGARTDSTTGIINKMIGLFKKGAVFASLSVVVQQPSAVARAAALVDTKYFIGPKVDHKRHKALWDEVKKYAPVAIIKEMGYFDTNMGKSTQDFITGKEYSGFKDKMQALVVDSNYRDEIISKAPALADEIAWCSIWEAVKRETKAKNPDIDVKSEAFLKKAGERFTEVITKTQVYDSVLSRSGLMRSKDTGMKMATAFMAEPTTSINMIADALLKGKRGNRKYARSAIGAVIAAQVFNAILVSFVYAGRDDDEDETYLEKYIGSFTGEMLDSLNPATYIPFIKDIISIAQGYDVERSDMAVISDLRKALENLRKDNVSAYRKVEGFAGSIAQFLGLPVKNIMRDARAIYQTVDSFVNGQQTTASGIGQAIKGAITGKTASDGQQLYEAYLNGDTAHIARVKARFEDQSAINTALRKAMRENDPRIREAAIAWNANDLDEYMRIAKEIIADGHFEQDDVAMAIFGEASALAPDDGTTSTSKAKGLFTAKKFAVAIAQGDQDIANAAKEDIIQTAMENGKDEEAAEKSFVSSAKSALGDLFVAGGISEDKVIDALKTYCQTEDNPIDDDDIYWTLRKWKYEIETGSSEDYGKYNDFLAAVQTGKDLKVVIKEYTDNGVDAKTLASQITSYFKPLYKEMSNYERSGIKGYLLNAYALLGYSRSDKSKDIDRWLKD